MAQGKFAPVHAPIAAAYAEGENMSKVIDALVWKLWGYASHMPTRKASGEPESFWLWVCGKCENYCIWRGLLPEPAMYDYDWTQE